MRLVLALAALAGAVVLALVVFVLVARKDVTAVRIQSYAMLPALAAGQKVDVTNDTSSFTPRLYDVVTFHPPTGAVGGQCGNPLQGVGHQQACDRPDGQEDFGAVVLKRVVGIPGDRLSIRNGRVIRNGRTETTRLGPCTDAAACDFPVSITIPAGDYFMLGDNRGSSYDSRFWGPVPRSWILGRVYICHFFNTFCSGV